MRNDTYLYTDGLDAARRSGQIALWRASHQANIACKKAIEDSIRQGFDGVHLKEDCAKEVLEEFGFKRVNWVLANTIQEKSGDGRFRPDNRSWAQRTFIPEDMGHKVEFIVNSHSEVVNGFVSQVREAYQKLNLFGPEHCEPNSWEDLDYEGKVLVLSPDTLRESCWTQENQLWYSMSFKEKCGIGEGRYRTATKWWTGNDGSGCPYSPLRRFEPENIIGGEHRGLL